MYHVLDGNHIECDTNVYRTTLILKFYLSIYLYISICKSIKGNELKGDESRRFIFRDRVEHGHSGSKRVMGRQGGNMDALVSLSRVSKQSHGRA